MIHEKKVEIGESWGGFGLVWIGIIIKRFHRVICIEDHHLANALLGISGKCCVCALCGVCSRQIWYSSRRLRMDIGRLGLGVAYRRWYIKIQCRLLIRNRGGGYGICGGGGRFLRSGCCRIRGFDRLGGEICGWLLGVALDCRTIHRRSAQNKPVRVNVWKHGQQFGHEVDTWLVTSGQYMRNSRWLHLEHLGQLVCSQRLVGQQLL